MRPRSVQFRVMTAAQVRAQSVIEVRRRADLSSSKLGSVTGPCETCGLHPFQCPGHCGHIELPTRCPHPMHLSCLQGISRRMCSSCGHRMPLSCKSCRDCGSVRLSSNDWSSPAWDNLKCSEWSDLCTNQSVLSLFITALPVPPMRLRLPNNEHDAPLTSLLANVLLYANRYRRAPSRRAASALYGSLHRYMQCSDDTGGTGLLDRIRGKQGRFRQNIMGWRVNYAGRAVITPDPTLAPWEVGVPVRIATEIGIVDGDTCILNRQPSLHRGSLMAHVARVRTGTYTLSISPTVTSPYNADFDGDEMNIHRVDRDCALDARMLMGVEHNMVSPAYNNAQIHAVQDFTLAVHLQTGQSATEQRAELLRCISSDGQVAACRELHARQLSAQSYIEATGFSVGLDDFCHSIPCVHEGRQAISSTVPIIADALSAHNRLRIMTTGAKSKGSAVNLVQLFSCVGYQTVRGQPSKAPHFAPNSSSFVSSSFTQGMTATEFWHHATAAREGMVETAIKTAKCGYIMRKLVKLLENVRVEYDDTVRSNGQVIQFIYGTDGFDATRVVRRNGKCVPSAPRGQSCRVEPGEPVGIVCAQCIGHPLTQLTLDTFHSTGIAQDHGIAAVEKLLGVSSAPPFRAYGLQRPYVHVNIRLRQVMSTAKPLALYHTFSDRHMFEMRLHGVVPKRSAAIVAVPLEACAMASMGLQPWQVASSLRHKLGDGTFLVDDDGACARILCMCVSVDEDMELGSEWALPGASLHRGGVATSQQVHIDDTQVYTSCVTKMADTLGIEAARHILERELHARLGSVDVRHVGLLVDYMTHSGRPRGIDRIALRDYSPADVISNASFESSVGVVAEASRRCRQDVLRSVSSRLTMGLVPRIGTGCFDVLSDLAVPRPGDLAPTSTAEFLHGPRPRKRTFAQLMQSI